jgi:DNA repair protein RecO (recombination protein O)
MPGPVRTEAVVLRSMRYGEADRILHLLTPRLGRVSAIAKGVRRTRSRFGGRLEPLFRVQLQLHEGRSDLYTVTSADTLAAHPRLLASGPCIDAASRACDAASRLTEPGDPNEAAYNLLVNELALLDANPELAGLPNVLAFRLKLLLVAGFAPALGSCANCGERDHLSGFSGAAGGVVCSACEGSAFPLSQEGHAFLVAAMGSPLADTPPASELALRQAERAISETVEYHAHIRLRPAASR